MDRWKPLPPRATAISTKLWVCTGKGMLESWLADLAAEQEQYGTVPVYVPWIDLGISPTEPTAAWGDAAGPATWSSDRFPAAASPGRRPLTSPPTASPRSDGNAPTANWC
jgi:hypothetical protein